MKKLITIILVFSSLSASFAQTAKEKEMVVMVNQVRTNPKSFIPVVEEYIKNVESGNNVTGSKIKMTITSNPKMIAEAKALIVFLNTVKPVDSLKTSSVLYPITKSHVEYLDSIKSLSHTGRNGQTLADRTKSTGLTCGENVTTGGDVKLAMLFLLIDYNATVKGHRNNIFNAKYTKIAVANSNGYWVQDFAF
jgi:uncharacterized protein YkwD